MADIPTGARLVLQKADSEGYLGNGALMQALPFALKRIRGLPLYYISGSDTIQDEAMENLRGNAFPHDQIIAGMALKYLSLDKPHGLQKLL